MVKEPTVVDVIIPEFKEALKAKVIYGYDTLCGWCYGFSDELSKAIEELKGEVDFELINGGLFAGIRGPKMGYMSAHIRRNMQSVTDRTGKEFGANFKRLLDDTNYPYNSMKASIAVEVIKDMKSERIFDFASEIQSAFFYKGEDIQSDEVYLNIIQDYGIDKNLFLSGLYSEVYEGKAQESFYQAQRYGFKGYPASVIKLGGKVKTITEGFVTSSQFVDLIRKELSEVG